MSQPPPTGQISLSEVARTLHASFRQLDFWIRQGHVSDRLAEDRCGSGYSRGVTSNEARVLIVMDELVHAGLTPTQASHIAQHLVAHEASTFHVGPVAISVDLPGVLS